MKSRAREKLFLLLLRLPHMRLILFGLITDAAIIHA